MLEVRWLEELDSAFSVQLGEWLWQRILLQGVRRVHGRRGRLLRRRKRLQLRLRVPVAPRTAAPPRTISAPS